MLCAIIIHKYVNVVIVSSFGQVKVENKAESAPSFA